MPNLQKDKRNDNYKMITGQLETLWNNCMGFINDNVSPATFRTWFAEIRPLKLENKELTIQVPSAYVYEHLESHYLDVIKAAITKNIGKGTRLMYSILTDKSNDFSVEVRSNKATLTNYKEGKKSSNKAPRVLDTPAVQEIGRASCRERV